MPALHVVCTLLHPSQLPISTFKNFWRAAATSDYYKRHGMLQVQEGMRTSKETLQKLAPSAAAPAAAIAACRTTDVADDDSCIVCLDGPADIIFRPCGHCVTCGACVKLLMQRQHPCPLCCSPVASIYKAQAEGA